MNKKFSFVFGVAAVLSTVSLFGCKGNDSATLSKITASLVNEEQIFRVADRITKDDIKVTAHYSDNTSKDVTDWECDKFDVTNKYVFKEVGDTNFDITYLEKSCTLTVEVDDATLVKINASLKDGKTFAATQTITKEDIIVKAKYSDNKIKEIYSWTCDKFVDDNPYTFAEKGEYEFEIFFKDLKSSLKVNVTDKITPTGMELDKGQINFKIGDELPQITATLTPATATNKKIRWEVYNLSRSGVIIKLGSKITESGQPLLIIPIGLGQNSLKAQSVDNTNVFRWIDVYVHDNYFNINWKDPLSSGRSLYDMAQEATKITFTRKKDTSSSDNHCGESDSDLIYYSFKDGYLDIWSNGNIVFKDNDIPTDKGLFEDCVDLETLTLTNFNTGDMTSMKGMFKNCKKVKELDLNKFRTQNVTDMTCMFQNCESLESLNVTSFDTSKVTNMASMFNYMSIEKLNLKSFNTSNVTDMTGMFSYNAYLTTIYTSDNFKTDNVTESKNMFLNCISIKGAQGTTYDNYYVDKIYAKIDGGTTNPGYFTRAS